MPTPIIANNNATFTIKPRNRGPAVATDVVLTDPLPAGWTFVSASGPNWNCSHASGTVTCTRPTYPVGGTDNITIVAKAPGNSVVAPTGVSYTNTATITSAVRDPDETVDTFPVGTNNTYTTPPFLVLPDGASAGSM